MARFFIRCWASVPFTVGIVKMTLLLAITTLVAEGTPGVHSRSDSTVTSVHGIFNFTHDSLFVIIWVRVAFPITEFNGAVDRSVGFTTGPFFFISIFTDF